MEVSLQMKNFLLHLLTFLLLPSSSRRTHLGAITMHTKHCSQSCTRCFRYYYQDHLHSAKMHFTRKLTYFNRVIPWLYGNSYIQKLGTIVLLIT